MLQSFSFFLVSTSLVEHFACSNNFKLSWKPSICLMCEANSLNKPHRFEIPSILQSGVLEAVRVSLAGYPTRKTYHEFVDSFGIIALDILDTRISNVLVIRFTSCRGFGFCSKANSG
ncbi:myosin, partial [Striga asiatica]